MAGRWGGEEFLVVISGIDTQDLQQVADRFRVLVGSSFLKVEGEVRQITLSAGAAMVRPGDDIEGLLVRADALLYKSKAHGRDCVHADVA